MNCASKQALLLAAVWLAPLGVSAGGSAPVARALSATPSVDLPAAPLPVTLPPAAAAPVLAVPQALPSRALQSAPALAAAGLMSDEGESHLCGVACAANLLGRLGPPEVRRENGVDRVLRAVGVLERHAGVGKDELRERGLYTFELKQMLDGLFEGHARVTGLGAHQTAADPAGKGGNGAPIRESDLREAVAGGRGAIVMLERWKGAKRVRGLTWANRTAGHFVELLAVAGPDSRGRLRATVADPAQRKPYEVTLVPARSRRLSVDTYRVVFAGPNAPKRWKPGRYGIQLLTDLVIVDPR